MAYQSIQLDQELFVSDIYTIHYYEYRNDFHFDGERHDFWEFQCVDKGAAEVITDNGTYTLTRSQVIFHRPNEFHTLKANGRTAPNIIVISFACNSPCMKFFENKILEFSDTERSILGRIIAEARNCFASPLDNPYLEKMIKKSTVPFGSQKLLTLYLEELLIHMIRRYTIAHYSASAGIYDSCQTSSETCRNIIHYLGEHVRQSLTECISYFRMQKDYSGTEKCGSDLPKNTGETLYLGSTSSELYMCAYQKNYEQYVKNGTEIEDTEIKNRFEIRMKNERAYYAVVDLLTYRDAERTAFSIINHYVRFVDREDDKPKSQWITNDDWAWFVGENREPIRLTTKPEPYTLQKALHWLQRQVAPTIKMVQALDRENRTTILKDMIEQAELKDKHKHLLQLEKSTIEERIDTAVPQENDGIF